jgi:hypothetical protein
MELMPTCPYCGCNLTFFEHYDCYDEEDQALLFADGDCPQCYREYRWTDVYKLNRFEDLEEVNKDEEILD